MGFVVIKDGKIHHTVALNSIGNVADEVQQPIVTKYGYLFLLGSMKSISLATAVNHGFENIFMENETAVKCVLLTPNPPMLVEIRVSGNGDFSPEVEALTHPIADPDKVKFARGVSSGINTCLKVFLDRDYSWDEFRKAVILLNWQNMSYREMHYKTTDLKTLLAGPPAGMQFEPLSKCPLFKKREEE